MKDGDEDESRGKSRELITGSCLQTPDSIDRCFYLSLILPTIKKLFKRLRMNH